MSEQIGIIQSPLNKTISDKFLFLMNLPQCLKNLKNKYVKNINDVGINRDTITWSLSSATIPRNSIKAQDIPYAGGHFSVSSHTKTPYDTLTIQFNIDNKYKNYFTIYEWMNLIYHEKQGHFDAENISSKMGIDVYGTNIAIIGTDQYNNPAIQWTFTKAFPVELPSIKLDYKNTEQISCSCSFKFSQMYVKNFAIES